MAKRILELRRITPGCLHSSSWSLWCLQLGKVWELNDSRWGFVLDLSLVLVCPSTVLDIWRLSKGIFSFFCTPLEGRQVLPVRFLFQNRVLKALVDVYLHLPWQKITFSFSVTRTFRFSISACGEIVTPPTRRGSWEQRPYLMRAGFLLHSTSASKVEEFNTVARIQLLVELNTVCGK